VTLYQANWGGAAARNAVGHIGELNAGCLTQLAQHGLRHARELFRREINPTVYTPVKFDHKRKAKDHFLKCVLDKPRLFVLGNSDELHKVAD
jgi:hypothetical protein